MKHIFLLNSDLFLIAGDVPERPSVLMHEHPKMIEQERQKWADYHAKIEQLKKGAIKVIAHFDNDYFRYYDGYMINGQKLNEGQLYELECETHILESLPLKAILKPRQEPVETQEELWKQVFSMYNSSSMDQIFECFNITRK